jgi:hypothetical protein
MTYDEVYRIMKTVFPYYEVHYSEKETKIVEERREKLWEELCKIYYESNDKDCIPLLIRPFYGYLTYVK